MGSYDDDHEDGRGGFTGKPQLKTPFQKNALEQAFQINQYPSEDVRRELGERISLTSSQIQVWFTHRRRKYKKDEALAIIRGEKENHEEPMADPGDKGSNPRSRSAPHKSPAAEDPEDDEETEDEDGEDLEEQRAEAERLEILALAREKLDIQYREDGPEMGFEFDSPPGQPVKLTGPLGKRKRVMTKDGEMLEDDSLSSPSKRSRGVSKKQQQIEERIRKRQAEEDARKEKQRQEQERRAKKEAERAAQLQQKLEQAMKKEAERKEREQQRERERFEREAAKEELRRQKEEERLRAAEERERKKEQERLEKVRQAEERRKEVEKRRLEKEMEKERRAEERRRDREMQKALNAQEKAALKAKQREGGIGAMDDEELEWELLAEARHNEGYGSDTEGPNEQEVAEIQRPPFPPTEIALKRAFSSALKEVGPDIAMLWSFCTSFPELLGLSPLTTLEDLLLSIIEGSCSRLLGETHIALIRLALADMEDSHAKGATQQALNVVDRAVYNAANNLEEAWAWGFETDVWRAHLSALTWPEVLRQLGVAVGRGRRRPNPQDAAILVGQEGEDTVEDVAECLKLKLPSRVAPGCVKACVWQVLAREGPEGLSVPEIAQRIQDEGLYDLSGGGACRNKTPEALVAGVMSRDILFHPVAQGTYALLSIVAHCNRKAEEAAAMEAAAEEGDSSGCGQAFSSDLNVLVLEDDADGGEGGQAVEREEEEEEEEDAALQENAEPWVLTLEHGEYNDLSLAERVQAMSLLVQMAIEGPTLRGRLESRMEESAKIRKQVQEENKDEKRRKQAEAAAKAAEVAREAMKALEKQKIDMDGMGTEGEGDSSQGGKDLFAEAAKRAMAEAEDRIKKEGDHNADPVAGEDRRRKERAEALRSAEEATSIRFRPLGMDRRWNKYWRFVQPSGPPEDPSHGRVMIEDATNGDWGLLGDEEGLQILVDNLLQRGVREGVLYKSINRLESTIKQHMPSRGLSLPTSRAEELLAMEHGQWLMTQSTNAAVALNLSAPARAVSVLTASTKLEDMPLAKLKQDMVDMEMALPLEAVDHDLDRSMWQARVTDASSVAELRLCLGELELAIKPDHLSPEFRMKPHLIKGAWIVCGKEVWKIPAPNETPQYIQEYAPEPTEPLQWLPPTVASVSLRLLALDAALLYLKFDSPARDNMASYRYIQRPTPPVAQGLGAAFHLQGHRYGDREYVNTLFSFPMEGKPQLFPEFPSHLTDDGAVPFEMPVEMLLSQGFVPEAHHHPVGQRSLRGRGRGPRSTTRGVMQSRESLESGDSFASSVGGRSGGRKGSRGGRGGRGGRGRGRGQKSFAAPNRQSPATDGGSAMAGRHSSEFEYGSFNGDDGNDSPLTSEDEEEDKAYEESDSPEISDMDSD